MLGFAPPMFANETTSINVIEHVRSSRISPIVLHGARCSPRANLVGGSRPPGPINEIIPRTALAFSLGLADRDLWQRARCKTTSSVHRFSRCFAHRLTSRFRRSRASPHLSDRLRLAKMQAVPAKTPLLLLRPRYEPSVGPPLEGQRRLEKLVPKSGEFPCIPISRQCAWKKAPSLRTAPFFNPAIAIKRRFVSN